MAVGQSVRIAITSTWESKHRWGAEGEHTDWAGFLLPLPEDDHMFGGDAMRGEDGWRKFTSSTLAVGRVRGWSRLGLGKKVGSMI